MKKIVFALEMMSLMLVLPVYIVVELNHPTAGNEKAGYIQQNHPPVNESSQVTAVGSFPNSALLMLAVGKSSPLN